MRKSALTLVFSFLFCNGGAQFLRVLFLFFITQNWSGQMCDKKFSAKAEVDWAKVTRHFSALLHQFFVSSQFLPSFDHNRRFLCFGNENFQNSPEAVLEKWILTGIAWVGSWRYLELVWTKLKMTAKLSIWPQFSPKFWLHFNWYHKTSLQGFYCT